ncbi:hypothetical protein [Sphingomonas sp. Y38-1Y]|uniref:hypothetical protein n=1 Tax=Sphingomonas sp. Y38-1Y TaxID=3078265 RepID=UPI0028E82314|nr:hypothetical protein [Sphingomonas sp. Y38-1Y]
MTAPLTVLTGLRARDVDRAARAAQAAATAVEAALVAVRDADLALAKARTLAAAAAEARFARPGDECVRLYLDRCTDQVAAAVADLEQAQQALATAEQAAEQARRDWMRAQARRDVITDLAADQIRDAGRAAERRSADECQQPRGRAA